MSSGYYLFWMIEFCIGALVGLSAGKESPGRGLTVAALLGVAGIVELVVVTTLKLNRTDINVFAQIASVMVFGLVLWAITLLCVSVGYWLAFWASGRLGVGGLQFGIPTLLAFVAIYAVVAAIGRAM